MDETIVYYALGLIFMGGLLFWVGRQTGGAASLGDATGQVRDAAEVAFELVSAAEQLMRTGQIERDERFDWVYRQLEAYVPGLTEDQLEVVIESAVLWLNVGLREMRKPGG